MADVVIIVFQRSDEHGDVRMSTDGGHHLTFLLHGSNAVLFVVFLDGKQSLECLVPTSIDHAKPAFAQEVRICPVVVTVLVVFAIPTTLDQVLCGNSMRGKEGEREREKERERESDYYYKKDMNEVKQKERVRNK